MGREKNPYTETYGSMNVRSAWEDFEQSVTEHECPGCEEGEAEGELIWQLRANRDLVEAGIEKEIRWMDTNEAFVEELRLSRPEAFRQIWRIVPTPEKVESQPADICVGQWVSKEDVIKILEAARIRSVRNSNDFAETMLYDIIQEIEELPSPPTH